MKRNSPITVFIVDNDALITAALKHEIEQVFVMHRVAVSIVSSAAQGELFMKHKPDIVVIDQDFGFEAIQRIKAVEPRTQVIMLTRNDTADIAVKALQHGVHDYVVKNNTLLEKIKLSLLQCITIVELRRNMREQVNLGIYTIIVVFLMVGVAIGLSASA